VSSWRYATPQVPLGRPRVPAGTDGGVRPEPIALSAGLRHLAQRTGVPTLFGGPNCTKKGMAFAASKPRGASG
jgi:hypothetical protein